MPAPAFRRRRSLIPGATLALCWMIAGAPCQAAEPIDEIAELKRAIDELRTQNKALARRLATLEAEKTPASGTGNAAALDTASTVAAEPAPAVTTEALAQRVKELEVTKTAQEDATRAIIRDSVSRMGSKINSAVSLGGAIEVLAGRTHDFSGATDSVLKLNTAELDFEIQVSEWVTAKMVIAYSDGTDVQFPTTKGFESGVERLTLDTAWLTVGDVQRFPLFFQAGKLNLDFGSSTGVHRADVLSIDNPLTTEAFETKRTAIGLGFGLPTPPLTRPPLPVALPPVRPMLVAPLVSALAGEMGYSPLPMRPKPPLLVSPPPEEPPFYGRLFFYEGNGLGGQRSFARNLNARLGYRASGHCGRPYSELVGVGLCPWSLDFNVDYNSSVFASQFLEAGYHPFLDQIGYVPGMASTLKLSMGPVLMVGEWNGAIQRAVFEDSAGTLHRIKPSAWQVSLGYQFDWNPWVEAIGGQGTYVALGYSQSSELSGAAYLIDTQPVRIGSVPRSRWTLTVGEWVAEGLKVALEYSWTKDYPLSLGGTGASGNGLQMTTTYSW